MERPTIIKFIPPKHLRTFLNDRGRIEIYKDHCRCSYSDICGFYREKNFTQLSDAVAFMESLRYKREIL